MAEVDKAPKLLQQSEEEYGGSYREHFLEQYKLFVDSAIRVTEWRNKANAYMLSVNTLLVTLYGLASTLEGTQAWRYVIAAAGIIVSLIWCVLVLTYKQLNSAKFDVVHELERNLPVALFAREWDILKNKKGYNKLTSVEVAVPIAFCCVYAVLVCFTLGGKPDSSPFKVGPAPTKVEIQENTKTK